VQEPIVRLEAWF